MRAAEQRQRSGADPFTAACIVAYCVLGWTMNGIGAVLPQLRDAIGGVAGVYPSLPGAALLVGGAVIARRRRHPDHSTHRLVVPRASLGLGATLGLVVWTGARPISVAGAVLMAFMAATLIRLLPAALTAMHPQTSAHVMTVSNAWSSLAGIAAPLAVGAATATGLGWRAGFVVLPALGALVVAALTLKPVMPSEPARAEDDGQDHDRRPWIDAWLLLTLSILVEFSFAFYASTYLREEVEMSKAGAAAGAAAFGIGMTCGRFLAGPIRRHARRSILSHLVTVAGGFALMWFVPQPVAAITGIGVAGFGVSLLYPIGIDRLMRRFPHSVGAGAARGGLASGVALCGAPAILGVLRAASNVRAAYLAVPVLLAALLVTNRWCESREPSGAKRSAATGRT